MIYDNVDDIPYTFLKDALRKIEGNHDIVRTKVFEGKMTKGNIYLVIKGKLGKHAVRKILKTIAPRDHTTKKIHPTKDLDYEYMLDEENNPLTFVFPNPSIDYTEPQTLVQHKLSQRKRHKFPMYYRY